MSKIFIAHDPGLKGGFTVLEENKDPQILSIPLVKVVINKKEKRIYDLYGIASLLRPYVGKDVVFAIEKVGVMPNQGGISNFNFGEEFGIVKGIAAAYAFPILEIRPAKWKKHFPQLESSEITGFRDALIPFKEEAKKLSKESEEIKDKSLKKENEEAIKINKKEQDKIRRQIKENAKSGARSLAAQLYPSQKDKFEQVQADGLAESLLLAIFTRDNYDKLVQDS
jgi:crossover junction endodeoxyribonuclease RuvC